MRVLYNEIPLGLHQTICNSKIHVCANYDLYVFWEGCFGKGFDSKAMHLHMVSSFS